MIFKYMIYSNILILREFILFIYIYIYINIWLIIINVLFYLYSTFRRSLIFYPNFDLFNNHVFSLFLSLLLFIKNELYNGHGPSRVSGHFFSNIIILRSRYLFITNTELLDILFIITSTELLDILFIGYIIY